MDRIKKIRQLVNPKHRDEEKMRRINFFIEKESEKEAFSESYDIYGTTEEYLELAI